MTIVWHASFQFTVTMSALWLAVIFIPTLLVRCHDTSTDTARVGAGVDAGKGIFDILAETKSDVTKKSSTIAEKLGSVAGKIAPFLGALGPAFTLISHFIDKTPTAHEKFVTEEFSKIDKNFDKVFEKMKGLENLIAKTSLQNQYHELEKQIISQSQKLQDVLQANPKTFEDRKRYFLRSQESLTCNQPAFTLYRFMLKEGTFSNNIPLLAMKYTENNRREVQKLLTGVLWLIIKGVKIHLSYIKLSPDYSDTMFKEETEKWIRQTKEIVQRISEVDLKVKSKWKDQYKEESLAIVKRESTKSNEQIRDAVFKHLTQKYDWRRWFVVVYNPITGSKNHKNVICTESGFQEVQFHGKDVVVASNVEHARYTNVQLISWNMKFRNDKAYERGGHFLYGSRFPVDKAADKVYESIPQYIKNAAGKCSHSGYRAVGIIRKDAHPAFKATSKHFALSYTWPRNAYIIYVFP